MKVINLSEQKPLILIENTTRYYFFLRIIRALKIDEFTLLHSSVYTYRLARNNGVKQNILLKGSNQRYDSYDCLENRINSTQYRFRNLCLSIKAMIEKNIQKNKVLWVFNGNQYTAKNILFEFKDYDKEVYFFEVGNFKSKIQIGLEGVNSKNLIFKNIYEYEIISPTKTKEIDYFSNNESKLTASFLTKLAEFILNFTLFRILKLPVYPKKISRSLNKILGRALCKLLFVLFNNKVKNPDSSFIFLGQVKNDTQLIMTNYTYYSLKTILNTAFEICNSNGQDMVYRFHPREYDTKAVLEVLSWCRKRKVPISNQGNIIDLSNTHPGFVTFNSTAGLQLISANKEVYCIDPECFYENWKKSDLDHFVTKTLLTVANS